MVNQIRFNNNNGNIIYSATYSSVNEQNDHSGFIDQHDVRIRSAVNTQRVFTNHRNPRYHVKALDCVPFEENVLAIGYLFPHFQQPSKLIQITGSVKLLVSLTLENQEQNL